MNNERVEDGTGCVPDNAVSVVLYRISGEKLIGCEAIIFSQGAAGIETALRRASISGRVEIGGKLDKHFADLLDSKDDIIETVALDSKSYSALKNKWMRCKIAGGNSWTLSA